ncbi:SNF2 family N-terminal domain-containing protein [Lenzites betulinus]|nr:SNF2 family N-terminal domain-containing protein [Lenzites betulinus]
MSTRRKSIHTAAKAAPSVPSESTSKCDEAIAEVRAQWIQERRQELDNVFDTHDSLIREAFHLEKFVSLLTYDPKAAKEDRSDVFQRFQAQYDLVDHTATPGPSRRTTRRAHTERLQTLKVHPPESPSQAPPKTPRKTEDKPSVAFWDIKAEAKSKGKRVHANGPDAVTPSANASRKGKGKVVVEIPLRHMPPPRLHPPDPTTSTSHATTHDLTPPPPRKKRRLTHATSTEVLNRSSTRQSLRNAASVPDLSAVCVSSSLANGTVPSQDPPSSPTKPIPRVKLIVRRPAPLYSSALHRPKASPFGGSIDALLKSFTYRFNDEVTPEDLREELNAEAAIWRRVDRLRKEGRMVGERSSFEYQPAVAHDAWAHIVHEIEQPGAKLVNTRRGATNVASKVKAHWSGESDRERKRLKVLARKTLEMVTEEWKKAVYHIREQERLEREEEERKLGQQHLDAILDQSGQILEVQLHDLARESERGSRSRSRSVSSQLASQAVASDEEESDGANGVDDDDASSDSSETSMSSVVGLGISMLIPEEARAELSVRSPRSPSISSGTTNPALVNGDDSDDEVFAELQPGSSDLRSEDGVLFTETLNGTSSPRDIIDDSVSNWAKSPQLNGSHSSYRTKGPISMDLDHDDDLFPDATTLPPFSDDILPPPFDDSDLHGLSDTSRDIFANPFQDLETYASSTSPSEDTGITDIPAENESLVEAPNPIPANGKRDLSSLETAQTPLDEGTPATPVTPVTPAIDDIDEENIDDEEDSSIPYYLRPYAVAPVEWDPQAKIKPPLLLRGNLRPYQQTGLEWLASIHSRNLNGILADEMGLGKTIQTIALLAHLACDRGIWGPHLIIVPTSVLLNWEMEFKKFMPGFKVLSYHGNTKQRKELRQGWNNKYHFNVCITSYTLASRDAHVFKRKRWYYMILDEAHMIKNFKSQRWNILLMFRSFRRLLLTGTPLQNNLTELWALLQFLMSGTDFANLKEFGEWFSNPLEKAIELGAVDDEIQQRVSKLHTVLRPYLLRRLKRDVEKELPQKYEHIVMCPLSKRQRFLYDEFMARADTRHDLQSGVYQKIANILMQLRKVVNHPNLFEVRPIVTSFAMQRSAIADFEIKELLVRRRLLTQSDEGRVNLDLLGLRFVDNLGTSEIAARETRRLDATAYLPMHSEVPGEPPPMDTRTIEGWRKYRAYQQRAASIARWTQIAYVNRLRTSQAPVYSAETLAVVQRASRLLLPWDIQTRTGPYLSTPEKVRSMIKSYATRAEEMGPTVNCFTFATPAAVARDLPAIALSHMPQDVLSTLNAPDFDATLHRAAVKLQIAFPDPSLLQYDCGKLQMLANLLRERRAGGHRVLIFTQMTRILDILEIFLNLHGYLYLRLDGATKIEDRQYITERFNADARIFCFISSSRSGGVGINLTGADTVVFYDSDFNPQMDRQCEDRAHRIGQIRDVHIYRFISQHTVEEALLRKANQKRSLDDLVIQRGAFDWRALLTEDGDAGALTRALGEFEDAEDAAAAQLAAREERMLESEDARDFEAEAAMERRASVVEFAPDVVGQAGVPDAGGGVETRADEPAAAGGERADDGEGVELEAEEEEGRTTVDYMLDFVRLDWEHFASWNV